MDPRRFGDVTKVADRSATHIHPQFDLASLTRVVATTSIRFRLLEQGAFCRDDPVSRFLGNGLVPICVQHPRTCTRQLAPTLNLAAR